MRRALVMVTIAGLVPLVSGPARADDNVVIATQTRFVPVNVDDPENMDDVVIEKGDALTLANLEDPVFNDGVQHNFTHDFKEPLVAPLFKSATIDPGQTAPVTGVAALSTKSYDFKCTRHPGFMKGKLRVVPRDD